MTNPSISKLAKSLPTVNDALILTAPLPGLDAAHPGARRGASHARDAPPHGEATALHVGASQAPAIAAASHAEAATHPEVTCPHGGAVDAPTVDDALTYAAMGFAIIPLAPGTKHPPGGLKDWNKHLSTDPATLRKWWRLRPGANIGYVIPRGVLVIDVDPRHGGLVGWRNLQDRHGALPVTWHVWTGRQDGGFHLYFTVPDDTQLPTDTNIDQGVQLLGPKHLLVLPPSIHPDTGKAYAWDAAANPSTMPTPAAAPDWLITLAGEPARQNPQNRKSGRKPGTTPPEDCYAAPSNKVPRDVTPPPSTLCDGPGRHLVDLACNPQHLPALLEACGLPSSLEVGGTIRCPFHDDAHPSASLLGPNAEKTRRSYGLYCHASACKRYYSLLDLFKAKTSENILSIHSEIDRTGQRREHTALRLQWLTRLLQAAGILHLYELGCPSLPPHAPENAKAVYAAYLDVRRIRSATRKMSDPFPFSLRFIEDWVGPVIDWTTYQINKGKRWLITHGLLVADGRDDSGERLWSLGSKALRRARKDAPVFPTEGANVQSVEATPVPKLVPHTGHAWSAAAPATPRGCPLADVQDVAFNRRHCEHCAQAYLEAKRAQEGIWMNPLDPYGLRSLPRSPTWEVPCAPST